MQYIEEVYKKNGSWDLLVRQIFVFVDLFAHGGSNCRLYFPCTVIVSENRDFLRLLSFSDNINHTVV